jgi:hypothetical protein
LVSCQSARTDESTSPEGDFMERPFATASRSAGVNAWAREKARVQSPRLLQRLRWPGRTEGLRPTQPPAASGSTSARHHGRTRSQRGVSSTLDEAPAKPAAHRESSLLPSIRPFVVHPDEHRPGRLGMGGVAAELPRNGGLRWAFLRRVLRRGIHGVLHVRPETAPRAPSSARRATHSLPPRGPPWQRAGPRFSPFPRFASPPGWCVGAGFATLRVCGSVGWVEQTVMLAGLSRRFGHFSGMPSATRSRFARPTGCSAASAHLLHAIWTGGPRPRAGDSSGRIGRRGAKARFGLDPPYFA